MPTPIRGYENALDDLNRLYSLDDLNRLHDLDYHSIETRNQFLTYISNRIQSRFFGIYEVAIALNSANIEIIRSFTETCIRDLNTFLVNSGRTSYPYLLNFTIRVENNSLHFQFPESPPLTNLCQEIFMPNTTLPVHHHATPQQTHSSTSLGSLPEALLPRTNSEEYYQAYAAAAPQHSHTPTQAGPQHSTTINDVMGRMYGWDTDIYDSREFTRSIHTTQSQRGQRDDTVSESLLREQAQAIPLSQGDIFTCRLTEPPEVVSVASSIGSQMYTGPLEPPIPMFQPTQELRIVQRSQAGIGVKAMLATQVLQQKWKCMNLRNRDEWRDVPIVSEGI